MNTKALSYMNCVILSLIRRYDLSEQAATNAVKRVIYTNLFRMSRKKLCMILLIVPPMMCIMRYLGNYQLINVSPLTEDCLIPYRERQSFLLLFLLDIVYYLYII